MKREQYIPFDLEFLTEQQLLHFSNDAKSTEDFKKLFEIIGHYFHYQTYNLNRKLKQNYSAFDPDLSLTERKRYAGKSDFSGFKKTLNEVLHRGNYSRIEQTELKKALENSDLIGLHLEIDFDAFEEYQIYVRGKHTAAETLSHFYFWKKEIEVEYYERVMIFLNYKNEAYFSQKKADLKKSLIDPGTIVLKIFKRVPKNDLETIFPNAVPKMSTTDKLLFWVPGIGGGISLLSTKVIPALIAMYAAYQSGETIDLLNSKTSLNQGLIALGVLGLYLFRQYSTFVNKKIRYSKLLSDSLYFKNLGNNSGAFYSLLNSSEEEVIKETVLAYSFLYRSKTTLTADELDQQIESWFSTELQTDLDFDVQDALSKLAEMGLAEESAGKWKVVDLDEALLRVDQIWDNIFDYNHA